MSIAAPQDPVIVERTRDAWQRYADELRDLSGAEYEAAEREAWDRLQEELADAHAEAAARRLARADAPFASAARSGRVRSAVPDAPHGGGAMQIPRRTTLAIALTGALALGATGCGTTKHENVLRPPAPILLNAAITPERISVSPRAIGAGPITLVFTNLTGSSQQVTFESAGAPGSDATAGDPPADGADQPERHGAAEGDRRPRPLPRPRQQRLRRAHDARGRTARARRRRTT